MDKKTLPDTPWHVGYVKMSEFDSRRDKRRCIHLEKSKCSYPRSVYYNIKCGGSSHCRFYAETIHAWQKFEESMRIPEEDLELREITEKYNRQSNKKRRQEFLASEEHFLHTVLAERIKSCPVCGSILIHKQHEAQCEYCRIRFIDEIADRSGLLTKQNDVFITGRIIAKSPKAVSSKNIKKLNTTKSKANPIQRNVINNTSPIVTEVSDEMIKLLAVKFSPKVSFNCLYVDNNDNCSNKQSKYYQKPCVIENCAQYKEKRGMSLNKYLHK